MTIGPDPINKILLRSVRLGNALLFHDAVDDRDLGRRLFTAIEDVVEPARADPDHVAVAPQLLPEYAHPLLDALLDGVRFQRALARRGERRPVRLLTRGVGLPVRDEVQGHVGRASLSAAGHEGGKPLEQIIRVVRTRRGFRMVLDGKRRQLAMTQSLARAVVRLTWVGTQPAPSIDSGSTAKP